MGRLKTWRKPGPKRALMPKQVIWQASRPAAAAAGWPGVWETAQATAAVITAIPRTAMSAAQGPRNRRGLLRRTGGVRGASSASSEDAG